MATTLRIVSQNVAKRFRKSGPSLIARLVELRPDVVALQEVTSSQVDGWCEALAAVGLSSFVTSREHSRTGGALLASRLPLHPLELVQAKEFEPRVAAGVVSGLKLASVYFPNGTEGWSAFYADLLKHPLVGEFVLVGDFQMAVQENEITSGTFAKWSRHASYRSMQDMLQHWRDAFRAVHGPERVHHSFLHTSGARWMNDHAFVPPAVEILDCDVDWTPIDLGLSDHGTLVLDLNIVPTTA